MPPRSPTRPRQPARTWCNATSAPIRPRSTPAGAAISPTSTPWKGWLYLATVIDLASRRVVGWAVADHLRTDLVDAALTDAIRRRRPASGLVFHSDRGSQGGFNRSSQHRVVGAIAGVRRGLRLVSSSRGSSGGWC
ncbi:DDE-type integrase/transposase/recombinase [Micromonospora aurantiaca (nom. illeg.)]|uniref:DDE-type integrase/transposase/recombinase n=1 Tax=Micromonospora aurantiaca (nom. illeg.) TaxID=47850 RepID=UPI00165711A8|nr:DDE-type integrase/transposase/recombinase [Micromonospora aurantiaca]